MSDEGGDGDGNSRELYRLIGNYERFTQDVERRLEKIEECIEDLDEENISRKTRLKIDSGLLLGIVNAIIKLIDYFKTTF